MAASGVLFSGFDSPWPSRVVNPVPGLLGRMAALANVLWPLVDEAAAMKARIRQAEKMLRGRRRSAEKLPLASRERSAARFEVLSLEALLSAYRSVAAGRMTVAARHYADATWFAQESRRLACWDTAA